MSSRLNVYGVVGFVFALIGGVLLGVSMGTTYWLTPPGTTTTQGLFQTCVDAACNNTGWSTETNTDKTLLATRAILFLAVLFWMVGTICAISALAGGCGITAAGAFNIISGVVVFIACGAYTTLQILFVGYYGGSGSPPANYFGYSYYICWASGAVLIVAGSFEVAGFKPPSDQQIQPMQSHEMAWVDNQQVGKNQQHQPRTNKPAVIQTNNAQVYPELGPSRPPVTSSL